MCPRSRWGGVEWSGVGWEGLFLNVIMAHMTLGSQEGLEASDGGQVLLYE